jgi:hypothetical protein
MVDDLNTFSWRLVIFGWLFIIMVPAAIWAFLTWH